MKTILVTKHATPFAALALAAFVVAPGSAFAQQAGKERASEAIEEVVKVEVVVTSRLVGRPNELGARIEVFELRQTVNFADLDLRLAADVDELDRRIENTAKEACEMLAEKHPIPLWDRADRQRCVKEAIASTDQELEMIFAAI